MLRTNLLDFDDIALLYRKVIVRKSRFSAWMCVAREEMKMLNKGLSLYFE